MYPAALLGFGVIDVPVAHQGRTYGSTKVGPVMDACWRGWQ